MTHEGIGAVLVWGLLILAGAAGLGAVIFASVLLALDTHSMREARRQTVK